MCYIYLASHVYYCTVFGICSFFLSCERAGTGVGAVGCLSMSKPAHYPAPPCPCFKNTAGSRTQTLCYCCTAVLYLVLVSVSEVPDHERQKKVQCVAFVAVSQHVHVQGYILETKAEEGVHGVDGYHPQNPDDFALLVDLRKGSPEGTK